MEIRLENWHVDFKGLHMQACIQHPLDPSATLATSATLAACVF